MLPSFSVCRRHLLICLEVAVHITLLDTYSLVNAKGQIEVMCYLKRTYLKGNSEHVIEIGDDRRDIRGTVECGIFHRGR